MCLHIISPQSPTKHFVQKHSVLVAREVVEARPFKAVPLCIFNPGSAAVEFELTPIARRAAAFCTRNEWNVMPFKLCNAPVMFKRLMDRVLAGMQWETCLVFLDDIIVLGRSVCGR